MPLVIQLIHALWSFVLVSSVIVFIHELGHYAVAKWCGVRITAFSIGFGKELLGWNDRSGTRWKICVLPLGGYVKMHGDASAASTADAEALSQMSESDKRVSFHHKPLFKKMLIVAAGPASNFILTIAILTYFILTVGLPSAEPVAGEIMPNSPAQEAGLLAGDRILRINDEIVKNFNDIPYLIATNLGTPVTLLLARGNDTRTLILTPREITEDDGLGNKVKRPVIGIKSRQITYRTAGLGEALGEAVDRTYLICASTLKVVGQMVTGKRGVKDLKGPVGIAQLSGQATNKNVNTVLWLIAMLSANLGLVNLFPIPLLDGGHLLYYTAEALRGRPLAQKVQEWGFRLGFTMLAALMTLTLLNDISTHLP